MAWDLSDFQDISTLYHTCAFSCHVNFQTGYLYIVSHVLKTGHLYIVSCDL